AGREDFGARYAGTVTYHDSCSSLRELGVRDQPRRLLARVQDLTLRELPDPQACCGFGGTFCVKYPELSTRMADDKAAGIAATGADTLLAADLGCLLNIAGRLSRLDRPVRVYHLAEVLAGMADGPGLGAPAKP
ncbi:MAG TPA: (Fe-S)-binding protein, partial [Gammaproteobacteria bacterium]|nr:(Fe-S)-binding protein [Gammaproteobacteria bacterium]